MIQYGNTLQGEFAVDAPDEELQPDGIALGIEADIVGEATHHEKADSPTLFHSGGVEAVALVGDGEKDAPIAVATFDAHLFGSIVAIAMHDGIFHSRFHGRPDNALVITHMLFVAKTGNVALHFGHSVAIRLYFKYIHIGFVLLSNYKDSKII